MSIAREKQIFLSALDLTKRSERDAYLDQACAGDVSLRESIQSLIAAHERLTNILDQPPHPSTEFRNHVEDLRTILGTTRNDEDSPLDRVGELIGHYRLLELIGEGGFGDVYVAQQEQPVRRRVAVKLLKLGMNSKQILARFEAERQALAMMDHPHIAQVFDAGTTVTGQPYFAMELVRGVPITEFCEQHQLGIPQRIELFIDVCRAVQHAHQKGVIHRDLKPSNVMVTLHDAKPVAKVIDFGVAKAIGEPLTTKTIYTRFMQMIGTPMYMSPEQAEMTSLDVDTRCDVFSLGMMLYELLTGTTPYDENRLSTAPFDELRRIIREEELPRPSYRLSTLGSRQSTVSSQRRVTAVKLLVELRGELDWIVMKAIEKDRSRRYESASALAQDLHRYVDHQPIEARPPSSWYRFTKFSYRHQGTITAASLVLFAMLVGTGVSLWYAARAVAERDAKELAREDAVRARKEVEAFSRQMREASILLVSGRAHADAGHWSNAAADYTRATEIQPKDYRVWVERGAFYIRLGLWKAAADDYSQALALEPPLQGAEWWGIPQLMLLTGNSADYRAVCQSIWKDSSDTVDGGLWWSIRSALFADPPPIDPTVLVAATEGLCQRMDGHGAAHGSRSAASEDCEKDDKTRHGESHSGRGKRKGPSQSPGAFLGGHHRKQFGSVPKGVGLYLLGLAHLRAGHFDQAIDRLKVSMTQDPDWPNTAMVYPALALAHYQAGQHTEAESDLLKAKTVIEGWTTSMLQGELGTTAVPWFDYVECLLLYREATIVIDGTAQVADPRLFQLQDRAQNAIH